MELQLVVAVVLAVVRPHMPAMMMMMMMMMASIRANVTVVFAINDGSTITNVGFRNGLQCLSSLGELPSLSFSAVIQSRHLRQFGLKRRNLSLARKS